MPIKIAITRNNILLKSIILSFAFIIYPVITFAKWIQPASSNTALPETDEIINTAVGNIFYWQLGFMIIQLILILGAIVFLSNIYYFFIKKDDDKAENVKKVIKISIVSMILLTILYFIPNLF